jgi:tetraacyldisaccharide 4'-kinase
VYGVVVWLRNWLFDKNILKSAAFNFPVICVGNLAVGGTGKTPMVEYLVRLLKNEYVIATISRGYKRKTKGFGIANDNTTALEIGDEPMQFHKKFPDITVAVGEERLVAIPNLLQERPNTQVIILDDAFQHRQVKAGLNILLTEYKDLYTNDIPLPAGDLRDVRSSAQRAEIVIVTKCNPDLTESERNAIEDELELEPAQSLYFSSILYGKPYHLFSKQLTAVSEYADVLLICGIANPTPLKDFITLQVNSYDMLRYPDHHIFDSDDLLEIKKQFEKIKSEKKIIITTEKDGVRLQKFEQELASYPIYVLPIEHAILFNKATEFHQQVIDFVKLLKVNSL